MPTSSSRPARRAIRALLRSAVAASGVAVLVAGILAAPAVAEAGELTPPVGTAVSDNSATSLNDTWGRHLAFEQPNQPVTHQELYTLNAAADGSVRFVDDDLGMCLQVIGPGSFWNAGEIHPVTCQQNAADQAFYFVPQNHTPHSVAKMSTGDQYFYVVSAATQQCVWSPADGFNHTTEFFSTALQMRPCSEYDAGEEFRVYNEQPNPDGIYNQWQNILNLAAVYASNRCGADYTSCEVSSPDGTHPGAWYRPNDDAVAAMGSLSTASFGCGTGTTINGVYYSPTVTNGSRDPQTKSVGSQLTLTNTTQVAETLGYEGSFEVGGGLKDVWAVKLTNTFVYNHEAVRGSSTAQSTTDTLTSTVRPGDTLMAAWSGSVYNIRGTWKFGEDIAVLDPDHHSLAWTMPATSSFPVTVANQAVAHLTTVTSQYPKNCDAGAASTIHPGSTPTIAPANSDCSGTVVTPQTAGAGTTLKACPGDWDVPVGKGSSTPKFVYQWYVVGADGTSRFNIAGATGQTFTVQRSTYSAKTPNLGVAVYDQGNADRLESRPAVISPVKVTVAPNQVGASAQVAANFVGVIDDAQVGAPYSANVLSADGSGVTVSSAAPLPSGLSVSADGLITGTPTQAGDYVLDLTGTPLNGGQEQHESLELVAYNPPATFEPSTDMTGVVGAPLSAALVPQVPPGMNLSLSDGTLPTGVAVDPTTGVLSGTPTVTGTYQFTLEDATSPNTHGVFTLTIADAPASLSNNGVAQAHVDVAYSASVASPGTGSLLGLSDTSNPLPDGLQLNSLTGVISGVPTKPDDASLTIVDLNDPASSTTINLAVVAGASSAPATAAPATTSPTTTTAENTSKLAATGFDAAPLGLLAALLLGLGIVTTVRYRRRRQH